MSLKVKGKAREAHTQQRPGMRGPSIAAWDPPPPSLLWHPKGTAALPSPPGSLLGPCHTGECPSPHSRQPLGTIGGQGPRWLLYTQQGPCLIICLLRSLAFPYPDPQQDDPPGRLSCTLSSGGLCALSLMGGGFGGPCCFSLQGDEADLMELGPTGVLKPH